MSTTSLVNNDVYNAKSILLMHDVYHSNQMWNFLALRAANSVIKLRHEGQVFVQAEPSSRSIESIARPDRRTYTSARTDNLFSLISALKSSAHTRLRKHTLLGKLWRPR